MKLENAIIRDGNVYKVIFADDDGKEFMDCQHCDLTETFDGDGCAGCDLFENVARFTLVGALKTFVIENEDTHAFAKKLVGQIFNIEAEEGSYQSEIKFVEEIGKGHFRFITRTNTKSCLLLHYFFEEEMNKLCAGETIDAKYVAANNTVHKCSVNIIFNKKE